MNAYPKKYPMDVEVWLRNHADGTPVREVAKALREWTGCDRYTYKRVRAWYKNRGILTGARKGNEPGPEIISRDEMEIFKEINIGRTSAELSEELKKHGIHMTVKQIQSFRKNHHLPSGVSTRYKPGRKTPDYVIRAFCEGGKKTRFKKGNDPHNTLPIGSIRDHMGYPYLKTGEPNLWEMVARVTWEKKYGPVPDGMLITYLNGDQHDTRIENMTLISKAANAKLNGYKRRSKIPEVTKAAAVLSEFEAAIERRIKE